MKVYIDTNIFLNVLLEENGFFEKSANFFEKINSEKLIGITSIFTVMEIARILQKHNAETNRIKEMIFDLRNSKIETIVPSEMTLLNSLDFVIELKIDPTDALHLAVAVNDADVFITRDIEFAKRITQKIEVKLPEEI